MSEPVVITAIAFGTTGEEVPLTAGNLGQIVECSGKSGILNLPQSAGHTGLSIGIKASSALGGLLTLKGVSGQKIDGQATLTMWAGETLTLVSTGPEWLVFNYRKKAMSCLMRLAEEVTCASGAEVLVPLASIINDSLNGADQPMASAISHAITIRRTGLYVVTAQLQWKTIGKTGALYAIVYPKGGAAGHEQYANNEQGAGSGFGYALPVATPPQPIAAGAELVLYALQLTGEAQHLNYEAINPKTPSFLGVQEVV